MSNKIVLENNQEGKKFYLVDKSEVESDEEPAYIKYRKVYSDQFREILEEHGKFELSDINQDTNGETPPMHFIPKSSIKPMKKCFETAVIDWHNVEDNDGNKLAINGNNIYRVLAQTDRLAEFIESIGIRENKEDEVKN